MKKVLLLAFTAAIIFAPCMAYADLLDTVSGTDITAYGANNTLNYTDTSNATKDTVPTTDITITVMPMYGYNGLANPSPSAKQATTPNSYVEYTYSITNQGNKSDFFALSLDFAIIGGSGWTFTVWNDAGGQVTDPETA